MVDLHVHYPMHLLGGVESPRDVAEQMLKVRAREEGKIRAAILNVAARLFNFRHWDGDWRVSVPLLQQGGVTSRAASCTGRSASWTWTSRTARRPRARTTTG